jgi:hypothetical protein
MWPEILFGQELPASPVFEPAVFQTEYHLRNQLYGGAKILREYAGLPLEMPVPWAIQQTCFFDVPHPPWQDIPPGPDMFMAVNRFVADQMLARGAARAEPIGFLYFYAREIFRRRFPDLKEATRRGTLVFPDKSTGKREMLYDRAGFARALASLPEEYQPVGVSIHWRDWQRGHHQPFVNAGLLVYTSGHPFDADFHLRQYDLCRHFKYTCSNDLSTSFCVAVLSGCHHFHLPTGALTIVERGKEAGSVYESDPSLKDATRQQCIAAAPFPPRESDREKQLELARRFAGAVHVREPSEIRSLWEEGRERLRWASPVASLDFDRVPDCEEFARWLPHGFYADGWVRGRSGFEVPRAGGIAGVEVDIEFPFKKPHPVSLRILQEGKPPREVMLPRGAMTLAFARVAALPSQPLLFECSEETAIGDGRHCAFRVRRMRACEMMTATPVL